MDHVTLTKKNCHRAKTVLLKSSPEIGNWEWGYQEGPNGRGLFGIPANVAKQGDKSVIVSDFDLSNYEVVDWKYEHNFEDLYSIAVNAFSMTSHSPEVRALQYIRGYEADLLDDLSKLPEKEHEDYIAQYKSKVIDLFHRHSRVASPMITGPARFPTASNQKRGDAYDNAVNEFIKWRKSYALRAERRAEAAKTPEQRLDDEFKALRRDIISSASTIFAIDTQNYCGIRSLFVSSIYGKLERIALNGKKELLQKALDTIENLSAGMVEKGGKPIFTKRHKVWKLPEVCESAIKKAEVKANADDVEIPFDGGKVVKCFSDDRLQIYHDEKPSRDVISTLKSNGFRWAPSNGCWQRQLTQNAFYAAASVLAGNGASFEERQGWIKKIQTAK